MSGHRRPLPVRHYAPVTAGGHRLRPAGRGPAPRGAGRPLPAQRARTRSSRWTRPPTTGSSATAWSTACASADGRAEWYRNRYVGSGPRRPSCGDGTTSPDRTGTAARGRAQHERRRFRRHHLGPGRGGRLPGRAHLRARHGRAQRLLRHPSGSVHRPPQGRPRHRRDARHGLRLGQWMDHIQYVVVGPDGKVRKTLDIPLGMTMLHDMSLTQRYAIVYDQPCTVDLDLAMAGNASRCAGTPTTATASACSRGRAGGGHHLDRRAHRLRVPPDERLRRRRRPRRHRPVPLRQDVRPSTSSARSATAGHGRLERWALDPVARTVSTTVSTSGPMSSPAIVDRSPPSRTATATAPRPRSTTPPGGPRSSTTCRPGQRREFDHGPGRAAGEPVFVARVGRHRRGRRVAADLRPRPRYRHTDFVVMDAADLDRADYVARVRLPQRVPLGFHGNWVSDRSVPPADPGSSPRPRRDMIGR